MGIRIAARKWTSVLVQLGRLVSAAMQSHGAWVRGWWSPHLQLHIRAERANKGGCAQNPRRCKGSTGQYRGRTRHLPVWPLT